VWERIDARVFDGEVAGDGLDDGLTRMAILGPRVDLQVRMANVPEGLDQPPDDLPVGRNSLLLRHVARFWPRRSMRMFRFALTAPASHLLLIECPRTGIIA